MDTKKLFDHVSVLSEKDHDMLILAAAAAKLDRACEGKTLDGKPAGLALMERYVGDGSPRLLVPQEAAIAIEHVIEGRACTAALTAEDLYALDDAGFYAVIDSTWAKLFNGTQRILADIRQGIFESEDAEELAHAS